MSPEIIGQIFGILATILTFISYQFNSKKSVLMIHTISVVFMCLSYLFLDASSGFALNVVCLIRNIVFYFQNGKSRIHTFSTVILTAAICLLGFLSWHGWSSLLMIVALGTNTVFISLGNPQKLRKSVLFTSTLVIVYNVVVFSIGGIANEIIAISSSVIGIVRFYKSVNAE